MSKTYLPYEPDQQLLLPAALQEWLPDDHLAYFISDVVDQLDMSKVTARYERERRGGPPYHPRMMVKVLLYGYCVGVASSRRIAQRLHEDIAFRVLAANNTPDLLQQHSVNVAHNAGKWRPELVGDRGQDGDELPRELAFREGRLEKMSLGHGEPLQLSVLLLQLGGTGYPELTISPPQPQQQLIPSHLSPRDRMRRKLQTRRGRQRYAFQPRGDAA